MPDGPDTRTETPQTRETRDPRVDAELMRRVASGEERAVGELYDRFGSLVFKMAIQILPTRAEAEDAVQEVFVRLWRTSEKYDADKAALVTWVMLLTRRHLVDRIRRQQARPKTRSIERGVDGRRGWEGPGGPQTEGFSLEQLEADERFAELMRRVGRLPELQQTVVIRSYLGGQTLRQIADELQVPLGTVKSALSRALVRLREQASGDADA